jgi:O-antigen ligase
MKAYPLTGLGPNQWRLHAHEYGFTPGKAMHSTWVSTGAELGFPGLICLASFYLITIARSWRIMRWPAVDPWLANMARMTIAALTGFIVSGAFVAIEGAELPYYVVLLGAVAIKLADEERLRPQPIAASGGKMSSQFLATLNPT